MERIGNSNAFKWPYPQDIYNTLKEDVLCLCNPPVRSRGSSTRALLSLSQSDYEKAIAKFNVYMTKVYFQTFYLLIWGEKQKQLFYYIKYKVFRFPVRKNCKRCLNMTIIAPYLHILQYLQ